MAQCELVLGPDIPIAARQTFRDYLLKRWPQIQWRLCEFPCPNRDARNGPIVALLRPGAPEPPADPADLAVIRWDGAAGWKEGDRGKSWQAQLDAEVARVVTPKSGADPKRAVELPAKLTRRDLLRVPVPRGLPLPAIPRVENGLCVKEAGCHYCVDVCAANALLWAAGSLAIDPDRCQTCGACVAACPTGALESASLGDAQWLASLAVVKAFDPPAVMSIRCSRDPSSEPGKVSLSVPCIGEIGWHNLFTGLVATGYPVELCCLDIVCPAYPAAQAALDKARRIQKSWTGSLQDGAVDLEMEMIGGRWARTFFAVRSSEPGLERDTWNASVSEPLLWSVHLTDTVRCTLCGGCSNVCPSSALTLTWDGDWARLELDASRCIGCEACARICPESVLEVRRHDSLPLSLSGVVHQAERTRCRDCGAALESPEFFRELQIRMMSANLSQAVWESLFYCSDCKARRARGFMGSHSGSVYFG